MGGGHHSPFFTPASGRPGDQSSWTTWPGDVGRQRPSPSPCPLWSSSFAGQVGADHIGRPPQQERSDRSFSLPFCHTVPRGKDMQGKAGRSSQTGRPALALWKAPPPPSELLATGRAVTLLLSQGLRVGTKRRLQRNGRIVCCNLWLAGNFAPRSKSHSSLRQPGKSLPPSRQHMAVMLAPEMPI